MHRVLKSGAAGLLCSLALAAPAAAATVTVRVEGSSTTLVPAVAVTPTDAVTVDKTATGGTTCKGSSGGGALELATRGDWGGPAFSFGQSVETIEGESHSFQSGSYWSVYVNNKASDVGICDYEPAQGDELLLFPACADAPQADCATGGPLDLRGPRTARLGKVFTVHADEYAFDGTKAPSAGATVTLPDGRTVTTGADGTAEVKWRDRGRATFTVTKGGSVRDELTVCVGLPGFCGSADKRAPTVRVRGIEDGDTFAAARAPRKLAAKVVEKGSGLERVKLGLLRRVGGTCTAFSGRRERFVAARCDAHRRFAVDARPKVSYLLPARLGPGLYRLEVLAFDRAGNRGVQQITFTVE